MNFGSSIVFLENNKETHTHTKREALGYQQKGRLLTISNRAYNPPPPFLLFFHIDKGMI